MSAVRILVALAGVALAALALPDALWAWTPGTHVLLGEALLANLHVLPNAAADLLRAFPYDFLYGTIAADSSMAKKYAPLGRHCHYWHVGQEIHDLARSDSLRAFGLGYLSHLAADTVAHNYFVPRQLLLTATTASVGHSYWESRIESHIGDRWARSAREVIGLDHGHADAHLDRIIAPTLFSVRTNRRLFRGMVHVTDMAPFREGMRLARERSRWDLADELVQRHLGLAFEYIVELLGDRTAAARRLDPSGEHPLAMAKQLRRKALREAGGRRRNGLVDVAEAHFALPQRDLLVWPEILRGLPPGTPTPITQVTADESSPAGRAMP